MADPSRQPKPSAFPNLIPILALLLFGLSGCASVQQQEMYGGSLPRPDQIIVFDFAVTPQDVQVDTGLTERAVRGMEGVSVDERQAEDAKKVAHVLAKKLVEKIRAMGLPAVHEMDPPIEGADDNLLVRGAFVSVDEGDKGERIAIGLGVGRSKVVIEVDLAEWSPAGERTVDRFKVTAKSARNPGMAETMGVGAVAGHLLLSTAVSAGAQTASETFGATVEDDTERAASETAKVMKKFFVRQGWITD